jgi:hypothetical protein
MKAQRARLMLVVIAYLAATALIFLGIPARSARSAMLIKPAYLDRYDNDPYSKAELRGKCTICHIGHGGRERNDFGEAFENAGNRITPKLRAKFPDLFDKEPH